MRQILLSRSGVARWGPWLLLLLVSGSGAAELLHRLFPPAGGYHEIRMPAGVVVVGFAILLAATATVIITGRRRWPLVLGLSLATLTILALITRAIAFSPESNRVTDSWMFIEATSQEIDLETACAKVGTFDIELVGSARSVRFFRGISPARFGADEIQKLAPHCN